jgi:chromosome segregation ATPase
MELSNQTFQVLSKCAVAVNNGTYTKVENSEGSVNASVPNATEASEQIKEASAELNEADKELQEAQDELDAATKKENLLDDLLSDIEKGDSLTEAMSDDEDIKSLLDSDSEIN